MRIPALMICLCLLIPVSAHSDDQVTVMVVRHRWHTGIVFPADRLAPALDFLPVHFKNPRYYELGWGDDAFYREDNSTWLLLRAMLWPTNSVLHVVGLDRHPETLPHGEIQHLCLSVAQLNAMQQAITGDFVLGDDGKPAEASAGLYGDSRFFPANGTFWLGRTCNTWTAQRLESAGVAMKRLTFSAGGVLEQLQGQSACP